MFGVIFCILLLVTCDFTFILATSRLSVKFKFAGTTLVLQAGGRPELSKSPMPQLVLVIPTGIN